MSNTQPIPTFVNSPNATFPASGPSKPRFTRTEKRQFAREKAAKAGQQARSKKARHESTTDLALSGLRSNEVDAMIIRLLRIRDQAGIGKHTCSGTLESRITKDGQKKEKKELSAKKLEKIQKRREVRAEKKKIWLEKKAAEQGIQEVRAEGASTVPATVVGTPTKRNFFLDEEINFDEL